MKYALKKIRMMRVYDLSNELHKVTLNDLKTAQFTGSQETVYAEGTDGSKLAAFDLNKVAGFNATNGTVETGYLAMQVGSDPVVVTNGNEIKVREVHKTTDGTTITLDHKASGAAGNEIGYIYAAGGDGMPSQHYVQGSDASATEFAYDPDTKTITLPTGVFKANDEVIVDYYPTFKTYTRIDNEAEKFALSGKVIIDAWFTDLCTQVDTPLQVVMDKAKISGEIDISFGDQAAVQNIAVEALSTVCDTNKTLWKLFDYNMQEIVD